jgi:hypothetical protein
MSTATSIRKRFPPLRNAGWRYRLFAPVTVGGASLAPRGFNRPPDKLPHVLLVDLTIYFEHVESHTTTMVQLETLRLNWADDCGK